MKIVLVAIPAKRLVLKIVMVIGVVLQSLMIVVHVQEVKQVMKQIVIRIVRVPVLKKMVLVLT